MFEWLTNNKIVTLLVILLVFGLFCKCNISKDLNFFPDELENFRGVKGCNNCPTNEFAHNMCHTMARDNCRIPTWQLNDCWLSHYRKCANSCGSGKGNLANCDCHAYASEMCRSNDDPAEACYASVHQKCLAGMGMAIDPDRGSPQF